jgi:hypothetical protein
MSFFMENEAGECLDDIASNSGLITLRDKLAGPYLRKFITDGYAEPSLIKKVIKETDGNPELKYIADALRNQTTDVYITDGTMMTPAAVNKVGPYADDYEHVVGADIPDEE